MLTIKTIDTKYHHIKVIINLIVKKLSIVKQGIAERTWAYQINSKYDYLKFI